QPGYHSAAAHRFRSPDPPPASPGCDRARIVRGARAAPPVQAEKGFRREGLTAPSDRSAHQQSRAASGLLGRYSSARSLLRPWIVCKVAGAQPLLCTRETFLRGFMRDTGDLSNFRGREAMNDIEQQQRDTLR